MQIYSKYAPTSFDRKGAFLDDRQDWLVLPVGRNRDSGPLANSNFEAAERMLSEVDPEGNDWKTHRFGHWGPGWFEIIIVKPNTKCSQIGETIEEKNT